MKCATVRRQGRRLLVEARRRVVVEAVLRARVRELLVGDPVRLERCLVRRPTGVDPLVVRRVVDLQRGLDLRHVLGARLAAVERNARVQVGAQLHRHVVDDAPAEAESDGAETPRAVRPGLHVLRGGNEIGHHLRLFELPLHFGARFVGAWIAAERGQASTSTRRARSP